MPENYILKDGIYLAAETAEARRLSGEMVRPYTTPEDVAQAVFGLSAHQVEGVVRKTHSDWEVASEHDIEVRTHSDLTSQPDLIVRPDEFTERSACIHALSTILLCISERGYALVDGEPLELNVGGVRPAGNPVALDVRWGRVKPASYAIHAEFTRGSMKWMLDQSESGRDEALDLIRWAFIDALNAHEQSTDGWIDAMYAEPRPFA